MRKSDDKVQESDNKGLDYSIETRQFPSASTMCHQKRRHKQWNSDGTGISLMDWCRDGGLAWSPV